MLSEFYTKYFRKTGASYKLRRAHCEGEVIPTEDGQWHWWVRTPHGRHSGEEPYLNRACGHVVHHAGMWEYVIPSDEPPLSTKPPYRD